MPKLEKLISNIEEIITIEDLKRVLSKSRPKGYIGFEPSGTVHLGWKICTNKIKDFVDSNFNFIILLADWHAYINDKLGGDIEKIRVCGKYMQDCIAAMGVDISKINFVYASDYISDSNYWELVLKVSKSISVARVKRAMDIMGRSEAEAERDLSKLFYPAMQVSDIFYLKLDVAYGGMDQRHAHMLARDVSKKINMDSPVAIHTPLLSGLQADSRMNPIDIKMSKSNPDSMISIHEKPESVNKKIKRAYCPEKEIRNNPILEICKYIIFPELINDSFKIKREEKFGGDLEFHNYSELEKSFVKGLHPLDLKNATAKYINLILEPIHSYFNKNCENLEKIKELGIVPD
jgi:tyrosyl-tRNA synthetase